MNAQTFIRYSLPGLPGESKNSHRSRQAAFNSVLRSESSPPEKLLADLLKRQARQVMADITECPPASLPAHINRLHELREVIQFAINHRLIPGDETLRSDKQLIYCATVQDYLACLEITRQQHRAPVYVSDREEWARRIERKLDLLTGLIARDPQLMELLMQEVSHD